MLAAETIRPQRAFGSTRVNIMRLLLGKTARYFAVQARMLSVRLGDAIEFPLPASLQFLYPVLRLPLWLWRRAKWAWSHE